jgi:hypothetical protein
MMLTEDSYPHPCPYTHTNTSVLTAAPTQSRPHPPIHNLGRAAIKKNEKYKVSHNFEKKEHRSIGRKMSYIAKKVSLQYKAEKIEICR